MSILAGAFAPAAAAPEPVQPLDRLLELLARRAELQRSMLFRFTCTESMNRQVVRSRESSSRSGGLPEENRHLRHALILEQGLDGVPRESRVKLDREGRIDLDRKGRPVAIRLPPEFEPIAAAVPQAQAAWFTSESQRSLKFRFLERGTERAAEYRIRCGAVGEAAVEFVDPEPTGKPPECHSLASGQMCIDGVTGDVTRIAYYHFIAGGETCRHDPAGPFSVVEQGVVEPQTGLRFPSRVRTLFSISWRDTAIFDQSFEDYRFTRVTVNASTGSPAGPALPPGSSPD